MDTLYRRGIREIREAVFRTSVTVKRECPSAVEILQRMQRLTHIQISEIKARQDTAWRKKGKMCGHKLVPAFLCCYCNYYFYIEIQGTE